MADHDRKTNQTATGSDGMCPRPYSKTCRMVAMMRITRPRVR